MPSYIRTLTVFFNNSIEPHQVTQLRGGIISLIGESTNGEVNTLFHNHIEDKFRLAYPLIQYKRISGKAAIVCLQEGCDQISTLLSTNRRYTCKFRNLKDYSTTFYFPNMEYTIRI